MPALAVLILAWGAGVLRAQSTNASLTGRMTDASKAIIAGAKVAAINTLIKGDNGALLIVTTGGIKQLVDGNVGAYALPGSGTLFWLWLWDRDGGFWIAAQQGLLHMHRGRTDIQQLVRSNLGHGLASDMGSLGKRTIRRIHSGSIPNSWFLREVAEFP